MTRPRATPKGVGDQLPLTGVPTRDLIVALSGSLTTTSVRAKRASAPSTARTSERHTVDADDIARVAAQLAEQLSIHQHAAVIASRSTATVREALDAALEALECSENNRAINRAALDKVFGVIGDVQIRDLTQAHAAAAWASLVTNGRGKDAGRPSRKSIPTFGRALHARLRDAERLGFTGALDFERLLPRAPAIAERDLVLSASTGRRVLEALAWAGEHTRIEQVYLRAIESLLYTPFRITELVNLERRDVDVKRLVALVRRAKGGKPRRVPLHPRTAEILVEQMEASSHPSLVWSRWNGRALSRIHVSDVWISIRGRCGIEEVAELHLHDLRHVVAYTLLSAKVPTTRAAKIMGHSEQMLRRYDSHDDKALVEALGEIDYLEDVG